MASAFDRLKKKTKTLGSKWKTARKAEGFKPIQSKPGIVYTGKIKFESGEFTKGVLAGKLYIRATCTVVEPDEYKGQSNVKDWIFGDEPEKTLESLARDMKMMFPGHKDVIAKAELSTIIEMIEELSEDTHDCQFEIGTWIGTGKKKGVTQYGLNIGLVDTGDGEDDDEEEDDDDDDDDDDSSSKKKKPAAKKKSSKKDEDDDDDDDDDDEEEEDEDDDEEEEEAPKKKSAKKTPAKSSKKKVVEEEDDDDDDEEEDEEDEDEDAYVPESGDTVKYGRSTYKVTSVSKKNETVTLKHTNTGNIKKGVGWDKIVKVEDEEEDD